MIYQIKRNEEIYKKNEWTKVLEIERMKNKNTEHGEYVNSKSRKKNE